MSNLQNTELSDVRQQREQQLVEIRKAIDQAYTNRRLHHYLPENKTSVESLGKAKRQQTDFADLPDNLVIDAGTHVDAPNEVTVGNPHDYKDLLTMALQKLVTECNYDARQIPQVVQTILAHEFEHHVPGLGHPGLTMRYGVRFVEDPQQKFIGFEPMVYFCGTMQVGVYRDMVGAVKNPSATDRLKQNLKS